MPASIASLTRLNGFDQFHCPFCGTVVFDEEDGMREPFCTHIRLFIDWIGEPILPDHSPEELASEIADMDDVDSSLLAGLFDENTIVIELVEQGRGGGHDGGSCIVVVGIDRVDEDRDEH